MAIKRGYKALLDEANRAVRAIAPDKAKTMLGGADTLFVDVRDVRELERDGLIPGAFHAPRGMLEFWVDPESPYHKPVFAEPKHFVLYCASGWRSALAAKTLQEMGLDNVSHLAGGFSAWKETGGAVEQKPARK
jgi:rhodanese-related sulfurtransferase